MFVIIFVIFFLTAIAILLAQDSFLNREYRLYQVLFDRPYLKRPQILATFQSFLPLRS